MKYLVYETPEGKIGCTNSTRRVKKQNAEVFFETNDKFMASMAERFHQIFLGRKLDQKMYHETFETCRSQLGKDPWNKGLKTGPQTEETKLKKSLANKGQDQSKRDTSFFKTPEYKLKQSIASKKAWAERKLAGGA